MHEKPSLKTLFVSMTLSLMVVSGCSRHSTSSDLAGLGQFGWVNYDDICVYSNGDIATFKLSPELYSTMAGISARGHRIIAVKSDKPRIYSDKAKILLKLPKLPQNFASSLIFDGGSEIYIFGMNRDTSGKESVSLNLNERKLKWRLTTGFVVDQKYCNDESLKLFRRYLNIVDSKVQIWGPDKNFDILNGRLLLYDGSSVMYDRNGEVRTWKSPLFSLINYAGFVDDSHIFASYTAAFSAYSNSVVIDIPSGRS